MATINITGSHFAPFIHNWQEGPQQPPRPRRLPFDDTEAKPTRFGIVLFTIFFSESFFENDVYGREEREGIFPWIFFSWNNSCCCASYVKIASQQLLFVECSAIYGKIRNPNKNIYVDCFSLLLIKKITYERMIYFLKYCLQCWQCTYMEDHTCISVIFIDYFSVFRH